MKYNKIMILSLFCFLLFAGCSQDPNNVETNLSLPNIYDVTTDKTTVNIGEELTVKYYTEESHITDFDHWDAEVKDGKLIVKDTKVDITHIVWFNVEITDDQLITKKVGNHVRHAVSEANYPHTYTESKQVTYYSFDKSTRITTVKVIVPTGAKTGYIKISDSLSVGGRGFCPTKLTITEN